MSKRPNGYWDKDKIQKEALKYKTPSEFQRKSKGAYLRAMRDKILNEVCSHMTIKTYWTDESLKEEALKYNSRSSFRKESPTAYQLSYHRGILDEVCAHMPFILKYWTDEMLQKEALKYKSRGEFQKGEVRAYTTANKRRVLDRICSHMEPLRTYWTDEMLHQEALKYRTRAEFQNNHESAYQTAANRNIIDVICSHMKHSSRFSLPEEDVLNFIREFNDHVIRNTKKIISPLELDIFVPELNLAIEYCGLYWHSEERKPGKSYHLSKMKMCNEKGIRLITIFGDEWRDRKDQIRNYLLSVMNKNPISLGARKTDLKIVNKKEAEIFLEQNHIQGAARIDIAFGLYNNEELVAVMTGDKHHRQGQEGIFVLNRLAFKTGISVAGGSSKLLKTLIGYAKEQGYRKLISWSDNRWSEGRVYEKMGFTLEEEMGPDYSYIKGENRISKQSCQKKSLLKRGAVGNTEREMALSVGLHRIWDCGKKRWTMNL